MLSTAPLLLALAVPQAPPGYYATVDETSASTLRTTLHAVIDDHTRRPYTGGSLDTWDILNLAQENPADSSEILDVYRNRAYTKGDQDYNREHTWPKSYGFPDDGPDNYPFTDCHMLHLCDGGYNSARSNRPFRMCSSACSEYPSDGGGSGSYPGNSNWGSGQFTNGTWEVWSGRRGDVARSLLYADLRYEGDTHGVTGVDEPDLILTDNISLVAASNTGQNEDVAYMGLLSVLLTWHAQDPVDAFELQRNDVVFQLQGNRNPFVDHPEWVDCLWNGSCGGGSGGGGGGGSATNYCTPATPNSSGGSAAITWFGSYTVADQDFTLVVSGLPSSQFGYFLVSQTQAVVINPGGSQGVLCLGGTIGRFSTQIQNSGALGTFSIPVDLTALPTTPAVAVAPGDTWNFTAWYRDNNPGPTSNFTDALAVSFD